jgi:DNA-binding response OmpR family regulator
MSITTVSDARAASAATLSSVDGVRLLRWPTDDHARAELADAGSPCILLVAADAAPPEVWEDLEDWVRLPLDPDELQQRARTLRRRARATERPWFDDDGLLRVRDQWLDLPPGPRAVVRVLLARFGHVVDASELAQAYLETGGSARESARKTMIVRVRQRLAELGLELHNVRDSGYLLDWVDEQGATSPSASSVAS